MVPFQKKPLDGDGRRRRRRRAKLPFTGVVISLSDAGGGGSSKEEGEAFKAASKASWKEIRTDKLLPARQETKD